MPHSPSPTSADPVTLRITEVGPRDGLQNETGVVPVEAKVAFINALSAAGFPEIEVTSFVSPKWVPQLGDAAQVLMAIDRRPGTIYSALVPNERGLEGALEARADKIAVFTAASETFSQRNTNATIAQTLERFAPVIDRARRAQVPVRAYVSCAVACPFEGPIAPGRVRDVAAKLLDMGAGEIDLGDTIGVAVPRDIRALLAAFDGLLKPNQVTLHLHDTYGTALACACEAVALGVHSFDASCGGLGGCPYAPGATGNLATEDLLYLARQSDWATGVELQVVCAAAKQIEAALGRALPGRVHRAMKSLCG